MDWENNLYLLKSEYLFLELAFYQDSESAVTVSSPDNLLV